MHACTQTTGLASLSLDELQMTCEEMTSKFQRLSDELISELQQRDLVVHEMDTKNRFISAMLKVQNLRHNNRTGVNGSSTNGGQSPKEQASSVVKEGKGGKAVREGV